MCAHSRHTFYDWQQSFNKASFFFFFFYGRIRLKSRSLQGTKRKSPFSVEWEWSSVIISRCRLASPGSPLWSLMKLHPLFLLLLTHATFTFKNVPCASHHVRPSPPQHTHTHHSSLELYKLRHTHTFTCRLSALPYCLSPNEAENFDVFTAGVINHKSPIKCQLVPWLSDAVGVQENWSDNELPLIVSTLRPHTGFKVQRWKLHRKPQQRCRKPSTHTEVPKPL